MDELVEFLLARLAEREAKARAAMHSGKGEWSHFDPERQTGRIEDDCGEWVVYDEGAPSGEQADHIVENDPASVLREVEAKRRIIVRCADAEVSDSGDIGKVLLAEAILQDLAAPDANHRGYRQEWAPDSR